MDNFQALSIDDKLSVIYALLTKVKAKKAPGPESKQRRFQKFWSHYSALGRCYGNKAEIEKFFLNAPEGYVAKLIQGAGGPIRLEIMEYCKK